MTQTVTIERAAVVWDETAKKHVEITQTAEVNIDHPGGGLPAYDQGVKEASAWRIVRVKQ